MRHLAHSILILSCTMLFALLFGDPLVAQSPSADLLAQSQAPLFTLSGRVLDRTSRQPIPFATVVIEGMPQMGDVADADGRFSIEGVAPNAYRLLATSLGYEPTLSQEYMVTRATPPVTIVMKRDTTNVEEVVVISTLFSRIADNTLSSYTVGVQQIEKTPGSNRDVSRIVQSLPGVAFSPIGYRNDLMVRGGSPSENAFFVDGFYIPNINHFSTQGASGGVVSLINADLIREIDFFTGSFPTNQGGALSSMLDVELRDGNSDEQSFKATLGASEVALSGSGFITDKVNYIFSARQSYLQLLFKVLGLPFLPNYIDLLGKVEYNPTDRDEITFLALSSFDDMTINVDNDTAFTEYIAGWVPHIKQQTYTGGVKWRRYLDSGQYFTLIADHSTLRNTYKKYEDNIESDPSGEIYNLTSTEGRSALRGEWMGVRGGWEFGYGGGVSFTTYDMLSQQKLYVAGAEAVLSYDTRLGMLGWSGYADAGYTAENKRFSIDAGLRFDSSNYNSQTTKFWRYLSPRVGAEYKLPRNYTLKANMGLYYQLPPLTALGYKVDDQLVNNDLSYMQVGSFAVGADWQYNGELIVSLESFYKHYSHLPYSINDQIPFTDKGNDYGVYGDEALADGASGRSYGLELMARWARQGKFSVVGSFTLFKSESRISDNVAYTPSSWDNRFIINASGTYFLPHNWSIGAKLSAIGGAPYTPYDEDLSSYVIAWDLTGQPYYDYSQHNTLRLPAYWQLDVRVDKTYYFKRVSLGLYLDIQNLFYSTLQRPDLYISTGIIRNEYAPVELQRYYMQYLEDINGAVIPTIGVNVMF